jgi:agmatine deiminase
MTSSDTDLNYSEKKIVNIGLVQTNVSDNIADNLKKTIEKIKEASRKGAQIVCLQELYRTKYFPQEEKIDVTKLAESIPGESTKTFSELAKEKEIVIIAPLFEKASNSKYYNTAAVIDSNGKMLGCYRKSHIPQDPFFYEKNYFEEGDQGYLIHKTKYANIGVLICYDQWFPEAARINALKGAEIIFYPTAIGYIKGHDTPDGDWHDAWKTVQRSHAIENGIHVAAVNRVGEEEQLNFWGGSFVCDSFGKILGEASYTKEEVLVVEVDLSKNKQIQTGWGFLKNRRPDSYNSLIEGCK